MQVAQRFTAVHILRFRLAPNARFIHRLALKHVTRHRHLGTKRYSHGSITTIRITNSRPKIAPPIICSTTDSRCSGSYMFASFASFIGFLVIISAFAGVAKRNIFQSLLRDRHAGKRLRTDQPVGHPVTVCGVFVMATVGHFVTPISRSIDADSSIYH